MPTAAEILDALPEFVESEGKEMFLELAEADQADLWGDVRYQFAIAYRAAHQMESTGLGSFGLSAGGNVSSERIGSLSVSYATPSNAGVSNSNLDATKYGRLLNELINGAVVPIEMGTDLGLYGRDWGWSTSTGWQHRGWWW